VLLKKCDLYLDINYEGEILSALRRAFLNDQLIFAFQETLHGADYTAEAQIYTADDTDRMIADITAVLEDETALWSALGQQHEAALAEDETAYRDL
jgi:hypothetical protein